MSGVGASARRRVGASARQRVQYSSECALGASSIQPTVVVQHLVTGHGGVATGRRAPSVGVFKLVAHETGEGVGVEGDVGEGIAEDGLGHGAEGLEESADDHVDAEESRAGGDTHEEVGDDGGDGHHEGLDDGETGEEIENEVWQ